METWNSSWVVSASVRAVPSPSWTSWSASVSFGVGMMVISPTPRPTVAPYSSVAASKVGSSVRTESSDASCRTRVLSVASLDAGCSSRLIWTSVTYTAEVVVLKLPSCWRNCASCFHRCRCSHRSGKSAVYPLHWRVWYRRGSAGCKAAARAGVLHHDEVAGRSASRVVPDGRSESIVVPLSLAVIGPRVCPESLDPLYRDCCRFNDVDRW